MAWPTSLHVPLDVVREETGLAPFLLQTEGLITDLLAEKLKKTVTAEVIEHKTDELGFVRKSVIRADGFPVYMAVTVVGPSPRTRALIRTLKKTPTMLFGEALKRHRLFHHKTEPSVQRVTLIPEFQQLIEVPPDQVNAWERSYAIVTPKGKRIAGVTEIFSPKFETWLREHPELTQNPHAPAVHPSGTTR